MVAPARRRRRGRRRDERGFGAKGKSFSSYVALVLDGEDHVSKIGGKDPRDSKPDAARYESLDAFRTAQRFCT